MRTLLSLALGSTLVGAIVWSAPGDLERLSVLKSRNPDGSRCCIAAAQTACGNHTETSELWLNPSSIAWEIGQHPDGSLAPGLPHCTTRGAYPALIRAAEAWNPSSGTEVPRVDSTASFSTSPALVPSGSTIVTNRVEFLVDPQAFATLGGSTVLSAAVVDVANSVLYTAGRGKIVRFSIWLNATTATVGGLPVPNWVWVAEESGVWHASHPQQTPLQGYADIQGVATHGFGHALGLGHSVVDSASWEETQRMPTMFPFVQGEFFDQTLTVQDGCGSSNDEYPSEPFSTRYGGLMGRPARTLEADDMAAVNRGYPTSGFSQTYGTITGTGVAGMSVVAVSASDPAGLRIGTLVYHRYHDDDGSVPVLPALATPRFTLSGLPPGEYYLFAETVDKTSYFTSSSDWPNYLVPGETPLCARCADDPGDSNLNCFAFQGPDAGCANNNSAPCLMPVLNGLLPAHQPAAHRRELFNDGEAASEQAQLATAIVVVAGQQTTAEIVLGSTESPLLEFAVNGATQYARRGKVVSAYADGSGNTATVLTLRTTAPTSYGLANVRFELGYDLSASLDGGHLDEVSHAAFFEGTLDENGTCSIQYTLTPSRHVFRTIFVQASVEESPGVRHYTNPVSVMVGRLLP